MSNYVMQIDFFGNNVRAETEGRRVSLTDLVLAGNAWRSSKGLSIRPLAKVVDTEGFKEYLLAASGIWDIPVEDLVKVEGRGRSARTMAHVCVAIYVAEQMSPVFHAKVIKEFIEGKLLEFREMGGTEFKNLNAAIDLYLPGREGKDNRGVYIQVAKTLRTRLMGTDAEPGCWDSATVAQIHSRYDFEAQLVRMLRVGVIGSYEQLKDVIGRL